MSVPIDVAKRMLEKLKTYRTLYQEDAVEDIQQNFGDAFVYENQNGDMAIAKEVLSEFRKMTEENVVRIQGERYWRFREAHDELGRKQEG